MVFVDKIAQQKILYIRHKYTYNIKLTCQLYIHKQVMLYDPFVK